MQLFNGMILQYQEFNKTINEYAKKQKICHKNHESEFHKYLRNEIMGLPNKNLKQANIYI
jgi:hypothetical protein